MEEPTSPCPASPTSPKIVLDEAVTKTHEIVQAVQQLQRQQEEADRKVNKEIRAHAETKLKIKTVEADQVLAKENAEIEAAGHMQTAEKLEKENRGHMKTRDALQAAKDDVASMRLQMDAMKVEMEAQRKAFVINVNWAARCTELKTKFDQSCNEYDQLLEVHVKAKAEMDSALRAQEEFRMKHQSALAAYTIAQEDMVKQAAEIASRASQSNEIAARLAELDQWKAQEAQKAIQNKLGSQQAMSVMQRSLAKGAEGVLKSAVAGWSTLAKEEKKKRFQKDKVMQRTLKTIATEGTAVVVEMFKEWQDEVDKVKRAALLAAKARLEAQGGGIKGSEVGRQRAIAQMEKQFKGEDFVLLQTTFQGWALGQVARKKKEQNHKKASRMISGSANAAMAEVFGLWNELTEKKREKNRKQGANMAVAGRMIADSDKILQEGVFEAWYALMQDIKRKRKTDEAGTAKALRMISNSGASLTNMIFDSWARHFKQFKAKDAGNKKALRMMSDSNQGVIIACWEAWVGDRANTKKKEGNTARAVRMINSSTEALQAGVYQSWAKYCANNRDKNKKMRALEKSFGAEDMGCKMIVFTSWQAVAKMDARKKKIKEQSMKVAIKSITGDADLVKLAFYLMWGRFAAFLKVEKLEGTVKTMEASLTGAVEEARVAVEEDLVRAKAEVERITTELETKKTEKDEAIGKLGGLEGQLEEQALVLQDCERQVESIVNEINESGGKANEIGRELGKVVTYIAAHQPRKNSRSGSYSSRPRSGQKVVDEKLPPISGSNSRPNSGSEKNGSKSARGVPGERGGSGRKDGRPPLADEPAEYAAPMQEASSYGDY